MPRFKYEAMSSEGDMQSGTMTGENSSEIVSMLAVRRLTAISVTEVPEDHEEEKSVATAAAASSGAHNESGENLLSVRIKSEELMIFTRQLATMVDAGLPIDHAFETLADQGKEGSGFRDVLFAILRDIRRGTRISAAIAPYHRIFPEIYVTMVRAAEASGELAQILVQLALYMENSERVRNKVKSAMTYPVIATCMIAAVAGVLLLFVLPKFKEMFDLIQGKLPLPTRVIMAVSDFARENIIVTILIAAAVVVSFRLILKTKSGRYYFDAFKLKAPIFGPLFSQVAIAKFSRTLSTLLASGVPIIEALEIVEKAAGNEIIAEAVRDSVSSVSSGQGLAEVFQTRPVFPPMLVKMINVGEQTGQLDTLLKKIADFYDERVSTAIEGLTSMIEPLLIGVLGLVVGGIVIAIFFPLIKITQSIGGQQQ